MFNNEIIYITNNIYNLKKYEIREPEKNKKLLLKYFKKQKGIYIFKSLDEVNIYVGHSINLYSRINSYFMNSILKSKARRVLKFFNKYGFDNFNLIIYTLDDDNNIDDLLNVEQYFIDKLKPNLNVDLIARGSGFHNPMSNQMKLKLREERGRKIYIYCQYCFNLLYIYDSKHDLINKLKIHHKTLKDCIVKGIIYLDTFIFTIEIIIEYFNDINNLIRESNLINLVIWIKQFYIIKYPSSKKVLASFIVEKNSFIKEFNSINSLVKYLKGDKQTICKYLNNKDYNNKLYRGKWLLTYKK